MNFQARREEHLRELVRQVMEKAEEHADQLSDLGREEFYEMLAAEIHAKLPPNSNRDE